MKKKRIIQRIIVFTISVGIIAIFGVSSTFADSSTGSVDKVKLTIPSSCTLNSRVDSDHSFVTFGGTYREDIGNTTIKIICNDSNGFAIYAIGFSGNNEGDNNLINSINRSNDIITGTATSGDISNWSMKTTKIDGNYPLTMDPSYDGFYVPVPSEWTKIAHRDSSTDVAAGTASEGSSFTTTYAAYITPAQSAGIYTGQVKYVMLHPSTASAPVGIEGIVYMQEFAGLTPAEKASLLDTMIEDQQYKLKDIRDGKEYWVAKLKDGNVWMTENLDYDISTNQTLTSNDTDLNLYGIYGYDRNNGYACSNNNNNCSGGTISFTPESNTIPSNNLNSTTWHNDNNDPYSWQGNDACSESSDPDCNDGHSYANNYYNWTAAIASNNSSAYTTGSTVAANSICPAGWRLPNTASMEGGYEFSKLLYEYSVTSDNNNSPGYAANGFDKVISSPLWFTRSGSVYFAGVLTQLSNYAFYWSSAIYDGGYAYYLYFDSGDITFTTNYYRGRGFPIRCLAK